MISVTRFIYTAILTVGCLIFIEPTTNGQTIRLINATSQSWAGGVCCRHGQIYTINLEIIDGKNPVYLDTLWVNGYCIGIEKYNPRKTQKGETRNVTIVENLVFDNEVREYLLRCYDGSKKGIIFSYYKNNKKKLMDISDHVKELEFLAYP